MNHPRLLPFACLLVAWAAVCCYPQTAQGDLRIRLDPPGPREFILDRAHLLDDQSKEALRETCDKLLTDKAIPIIIVSIESMADYGGAGLRIETFARLLFDQWQIGHAQLKTGPGGNTVSWNNGILLLVSVGDRKARIELGADWGREKDQLCQQIMNERIVPQFKQGDFSGGITAGVEALNAMAREKQLPAVPRPWWHYALIVAFIGLAIFTVVSLIRNGSRGWAWLFWGVVFSIVGYLLYQVLTSSSGSSGGGGFSGGSYGGGFSGGGGATGSW